MLITEMFGPTIQGEGPHAGLNVGFLRLANCNLACSWCDTPYSWDWSRYDREQETREVDVTDVLTSMTTLGVNRFVVTGGEPLIQQSDLAHLASETDILIDVETNGTIVPSVALVNEIDLFVVSPKLANAGDRITKRIRSLALQKFQESGKAVFKFVAQTEDDLDEIQHLVDEHSLTNIWAMPEGATREQHLTTLTRLVDPIVARGWNLSTRLHVLAWDAKRGV